MKHTMYIFLLVLKLIPYIYFIIYIIIFSNVTNAFFHHFIFFIVFNHSFEISFLFHLPISSIKSSYYETYTMGMPFVKTNSSRVVAQSKKNSVDNEICTNFQCDQTKCIQTSLVCDGVIDCKTLLEY